ncbi:NH(3)-dependent NAD(+) synthetase [Bienertia sinuspersici]
MAPFGKKATYIASRKIGSTRGQGFKAPFLPGVFSKENHSASNDVPHISNANDRSINKAPRKEENPLHTSIVAPLNEDVHEDDMLQRSINNDALSRFIDQSASEGDLSMHEEETTVTTAVVTQKRKRKSDARPRSVNKCKKVANLKPVGENHKDLTRHMGKLVRDRTICPVRVRSWDEIESKAKEHMWQSVLLTTHLHEKEKENDDLEKRIDEMEKAHQVEREANARKINSLNEKFNFLMNAYMKQSNGGDNTN